MNKLSILVCDDSREIREELIHALEKLGVKNFYEASNGEEALDVCEKHLPDLVFMDIIMPKKDGVAALKEIHQKFPHIKVVLSSSSKGQAHLKNTKLLGAYSFIQKPVDENKLNDIITRFLNEKQHLN